MNEEIGEASLSSERSHSSNQPPSRRCAEAGDISRTICTLFDDMETTPDLNLQEPRRIRRLSELPSTKITLTAGDDGYNCNIMAHAGLVPIRVVLDTGCVYSFTCEEFLVQILNRSMELGVGPDDPDWPLDGPVEFPSTPLTASTMQASDGIIVYA